MLNRFQLFSSISILAISSVCLTGCGPETRSEETATIDGTVTYQGNPVPDGSRLILEDKARGVRMSFTIESGGKYEVTATAALPAGKYNVAILPPAGTSDSEANYEAAMENPEAANETKQDDFPVPQEMQDPATSGKTVDVASGSQTLDIKL